ncbi:MAG: hydroxymethylglutaryl-CoA lyase [Deltaproteobacteria bacterium HGW-Deltaproteobacteria-19]|jgi:hydroxymethylglutaryl-CoA lyase|nr:MAG: hydroxymethylglutaryl-CoA lyase [Deltaproteobacteria bacterium HGW-Deltaproteobacteria-19]
MNPADLRIVEVGPRDGLQNLSAFVATDRKTDLIRRLAACGIREIQTGAFVNPRAIPQFRDMKDVLAGVRSLQNDGVVLTTLVPNLQGARDAVAAGVDKLDFFFSVSRSHNLNNVRQTPQESIAALRQVLDEFKSNRGLAIRVNLATVFGCPFEGYLETAVILKYVEKTARLGVREITLCDTVGWGYPSQVEAILKGCLAAFPEVVFGVHLHNTRGLGLANALKAWETGIRVFDSAIGGLGGCPFAPGASGNVATEDLVFLFQSMGVSTGIDLDMVLDTASFLQGILPDTPLTSSLFRAGPPRKVPFGTEEGGKSDCVS